MCWQCTVSRWLDSLQFPAARDLVNRAFEDQQESYKRRVRQELCDQGIYRLEDFGRIQQKWLVRNVMIPDHASADRRAREHEV